MARVRRIAAAALVGLLIGTAAACDTPSPHPDTSCEATGVRLAQASADVEEDDRIGAMDGRERPEWVAGDSTYSLPLPDGRVLWLYSDSFIGSLTRRGEALPGTVMVHNALVVESPDGSTRTLTGRTEDGTPSSFFPDVSSSTYYWVQDATVEGDRVTVFLARTTGKGTEFQWTGTAIARLRLPELSLESITDAPPVGQIAWGAAITETETATYIYGVEDLGATKHLHVARAPVGAVTDRSRWEYYDAHGWSRDPSAAARIEDGVSNELSVQPYRDGYLMVTGDGSGIFSPKVQAYLACHPGGPWGEPTTIYTAPESGEGEHFAYNAHAHPGLPGQRPDELLVSYNVNTFDSAELFATPSVYRPRFIRLRLP